MGWSGRAPAPPAREAGKGRQSPGARHVTQTLWSNRRDRHRYRQELVPRRRPGSAPCNRGAAEVEARGGDHSPPGESVLAIDVFSFSLFSSSLSRRFFHRASGFRKIPSHISGESLIACDKRRHETRVSEKSRAVMLRSCNMSGWEEDFFSA